MERLSIQNPQSGCTNFTRPGAQSALFRLLDSMGDFLRRLDVIDLDVDHALPDPDLRTDLLQRLKVILRAVGKFENEVIGMQGVEKLNQGLPFAGLNGLPSIVAKAKMNPGGTLEGIKDAVDGLGGKGRVPGYPEALASSTCKQEQGSPWT